MVLPMHGFYLGAVIRKQSCDLDRKCLSQTGGTACIEKLAKELISKAFFFFFVDTKVTI